jgi:hypothetical protein
VGGPETNTCTRAGNMPGTNAVNTRALLRAALLLLPLPAWNNDHCCSAPVALLAPAQVGFKDERAVMHIKVERKINDIINRWGGGGGGRGHNSAIMLRKCA